jgi:hypothetical protein
MHQGLIGHTGFVGQTLARQQEFSAQFNSSSIHKASDQSFDRIVCAAAPGSMFEANRFPDRDHLAIDGLIRDLSMIQAKQIVLISTIAVLDRFDGQALETTTDFQATLAYGLNRRRLEQFCQSHFNSCLIVRLPALFGPGLRKNFIFDLMNPVPSLLAAPRYEALRAVLPQPLKAIAHYTDDPALGLFVLDRAALNASALRPDLDRFVLETGFSAIAFTNPESSFQFYDMTRLWSDIRVALDANLSIIHLAPEPVLARDVHQRLTGRTMPASEARVHNEDMRSGHAGLWGKSGPYLMPSADSLSGLARFHAEATA